MCGKRWLGVPGLLRSEGPEAYRAVVWKGHRAIFPLHWELTAESSSSGLSKSSETAIALGPFFFFSIVLPCIINSVSKVAVILNSKV